MRLEDRRGGFLHAARAAVDAAATRRVEREQAEVEREARRRQEQVEARLREARAARVQELRNDASQWKEAQI